MVHKPEVWICISAGFIVVFAHAIKAAPEPVLAMKLLVVLTFPFNELAIANG